MSENKTEIVAVEIVDPVEYELSAEKGSSIMDAFSPSIIARNELMMEYGKIIKMKENGDLSAMADDFRSILQLVGGISKAALAFVGLFMKIGNALNEFIIQPVDRLTDKIAKLANIKLGRKNREQFIESASGADALNSRAANQIRLNARRARQLAPAQTAVDQVINSGQGLDILGQIAAFMKVNAENTGVVAGTISTGVS